MALPDEKTFLLELGKVLRQFRERAGLSLDEAERLLEEKARDAAAEYEAGEILRGFRQRSGLTLEEVARRMGREPSDSREIASWERDEGSPSFYDIALYLEVVDASFYELEEEWSVRQRLVN